MRRKCLEEFFPNILSIFYESESIGKKDLCPLQGGKTERKALRYLFRKETQAATRIRVCYGESRGCCAVS